MEVIRRGIHPDDYRYIVTCYRCHSELRCSKKDSTEDCGRSLGHYLFMVRCPVCDAFINVKEDNEEKEQPLKPARLTW